jgi:hypothetical protein
MQKNFETSRISLNHQDIKGQGEQPGEVGRFSQFRGTAV